eukprot:3170372-Prymnesium_polylepis.2
MAPRSGGRGRRQVLGRRRAAGESFIFVRLARHRHNASGGEHVLHLISVATTGTDRRRSKAGCECVLLPTKDFFVEYCASGTLFTLKANDETTASARIEWAEELQRNFVRQMNFHYIDSYSDTENPR